MNYFIIQIPKCAININGQLMNPDDYKVNISKNKNKVKDFYILPNQYDEEDDDDDYTDEIDLKNYLFGVLHNLNITNINCTESIDKKILEISFCILANESKRVINNLNAIGIGETVGNILAIPIDIIRPKLFPTTKEIQNSTFIETIKAKLVIDKIIDIVRSSADLDFDYVCLVMVASILSFFGLIYDNSIIIVAAMLISPIMGPVTALIFSYAVNDKLLFKKALYNELISLALCVFNGFILGVLCIPLLDQLSLPTGEILNRSNFLGLIIGMIVAIPSGIGVALSVLGEKTNSLVGVAISASLLPPAVNTGLLLAISLGSIIRDIQITDEILLKSMISFSLTLSNIIIIFIVGIIMFKIKEVAKVPNQKKFAENIALAKNYKKIVKDDNNELYNNIIQPILNDDNMNIENMNIEHINNNINNKINSNINEINDTNYIEDMLNQNNSTVMLDINKKRSASFTNVLQSINENNRSRFGNFSNNSDNLSTNKYNSTNSDNNFGDNNYYKM